MNKAVRAEIVKAMKNVHAGNRRRLSKIKTLTQAEKQETRSLVMSDASTRYYSTVLKDGIRVWTVYKQSENKTSVDCTTIVSNFTLTKDQYIPLAKELNAYLRSASGAKNQEKLYVISTQEDKMEELNEKKKTEIYKKLKSGKSQIIASYWFDKECYQFTMYADQKGEISVEIMKKVN